MMSACQLTSLCEAEGYLILYIVLHLGSHYKFLCSVPGALQYREALFSTIPAFLMFRSAASQLDHFFWAYF